MKCILYVIIWGLVFSGCMAPSGYRIEGSIPGAEDGVRVYLEVMDEYPSRQIDSTVIKNEKFVLESDVKMASPRMTSVVFNLTPEETNFRKMKKRASSLFLADGDRIYYECSVDSLPSYYFEPRDRTLNVTVRGGKDQDLFTLYQNQTAELRDKRRELRTTYLMAKEDIESGKVTLHEVMDMVRERAKVVEELNQRIIQFVKEHGNSIVSIYASTWLLEANPSGVTAGEIDELIAGIDPALHDSPIMLQFKESAERAKAFAKGKKYMDIELTDLEGKNVQLSEYIEPGQCNMLEFWASWCGPCRGEIPHLRHIYDLCEDGSFNMISISLDERKADWQKAVKEENMSWTQLNDPLGMKGPVREVYQVNGIPFCLILDRDGCIAYGGVRGVELDVALLNLLRDKLKL